MQVFSEIWEVKYAFNCFLKALIYTLHNIREFKYYISNDLAFWASYLHVM